MRRRCDSLIRLAAAAPCHAHLIRQLGLCGLDAAGSVELQRGHQRVEAAWHACHLLPEGIAVGAEVAQDKGDADEDGAVLTVQLQQADLGLCGGDRGGGDAPVQVGGYGGDGMHLCR